MEWHVLNVAMALLAMSFMLRLPAITDRTVLHYFLMTYGVVLAETH